MGASAGVDPVAVAGDERGALLARGPQAQGLAGVFEPALAEAGVDAQVELLKDRRADTDIACPVAVDPLLRAVVVATVGRAQLGRADLVGMLEPQLDADVLGASRVEVGEGGDPKPGEAGDHQRRDGRRDQPAF